ncbi:hypothetical protein M422DRAFT_84678, partial [Sphaerobolus stellatus SS14]
MAEEHSSGSYKIEPLEAHNWLPWKKCMQAILSDLGLEKHIAKDARPPKLWLEGNRKAQTRIILGFSDLEMVNISGTITASEMWQQLSTVKEARGRLGILVT